MESGGSATGDHGRHHLDQQQPLQPPAGWSFASVGGVLRLVPSYTCVYCKREFPSAQALGGHTNAHRKERASLRRYHLRSRLPNLNISPPVTTPAVHSFFSTTAADEAATSMVAAAKAAALEVNLELEGGGGGGLDLELRLGCS